MGNSIANSKQPKQHDTKTAPHHPIKDQQQKPAVTNCHNKSQITLHQCCDIKSDEFLIKLHHEQVRRGIANQPSTALAIMDQRRLVFVSLIGLYKTWDLCPAALLYSSIFVLPLKRKWIYHHKKYKNEIQQSIIAEITIFKDKTRFTQFVELLKWKDSQNLAFWMLNDEYKMDEYEEDKKDDNINPLIAAFWTHFNGKLITLYDPITKSTYEPIKFNAEWWQSTYNTLIKSKYSVERYKILMELYFVTMKFKAMQEIIFQSNPSSLNPITSYNPYKSDIKSNKISFVSLYRKSGLCDYGGFVSLPNGCCHDIDSDDNDEDNNGIWMISTEYNEYL